jgi:hypothetical protein
LIFPGKLRAMAGVELGDDVIFGCVCEVVKCLNDFPEKT